MRKVLISIMACLPLLAYGQNDIQLSQQFLSRVNYNPAATGASNYTNVFLIARQQWIGMTAPSTQVLNAHNYFNQINSGVGLSVTNDHIGPEATINAKVGYSYYLHFEGSYLSFGLGAGILHKSLDRSKIVTESRLEDDHLAMQYINKPTKLNPDFDFGVEFNTEFLQIGASVTHLNKSSIQIGNLESGRHFYLYGKYTFNLDLDWKIAPGLVGHMSSWPIMQMDVNTMATFRDRFWFGASYRFSDAFVSESIVAVAGLFITDFLGLGYSYDFNPGPIKQYSSGSHEVSLRVRLGKGDTGGAGKTPRFFE